MRIKFLSLLFLFLTSTPVFSQLAMGKWRIHFAYSNVTDLAQTPDKVFAVAGALFSVNKKTAEKEIYDKTKGLNGVVVSKIEYDEQNEQLLIAYENGNIDLMTKNGILNIPDFHEKIMNTDKKINDIYIHNNKAYLSCNFGILILNLERKEISEACYIGANAEELVVVNTTVYDGFIYALTHNKTSEATKEFQLLRAPVEGANLLDYRVWESVLNLPKNTSENYQSVFSFRNNLLLQINSRLFLKQNESWIPFLETYYFQHVSVSNGKLISSNGSGASQITNEKLQTDVYTNFGNLLQGIYDEKENNYWFALGNDGLGVFEAENNSFKKFEINGPSTANAWDMSFAGEKLFVVPGGRWTAFYGRKGDVMTFENETWTNILAEGVEAITGVKLADLVSIAVNPENNTHFFATSYGSGLYEFRENKFYKHYNYKNSLITAIYPEWANTYQWTDGATFDNKGNLWFLNSLSPKSIKILMKDGSWNELGYSDFNNLESLHKILISNQNPNQKWAFGERHLLHRRLFVFDDNGTIADQSDDKSKMFSSFINTDLPGEPITPAYYHCIAQDKNGVIWLGTDLGPLIFNNPERVFEPNYSCSRIKIPRKDGSDLADYLLDGEPISAIAIDAFNRKWIGTKQSGVFLVSESGQETIHHFTSKNSPLLTDEIFSIAINPETGEVFFATGAGVISFQGDAATAKDNFDKAYVYPNPVREDYSGPVTIKGLVEKTELKITDLNGNLICEMTSKGSVAVWDACDAFGKKVSTGVYFILCFSPDGGKQKILKLLVIN